MFATGTIEEAQAHLAELVSKLAPGEEVVITDNQQPVARLLPVKSKAQRKLGTMRGSIKYSASDFDAPLDDFRSCLGKEFLVESRPKIVSRSGQR